MDCCWFGSDVTDSLHKNMENVAIMFTNFSKLCTLVLYHELQIVHTCAMSNNVLESAQQKVEGSGTGVDLEENGKSLKKKTL